MSEPIDPNKSNELEELRKITMTVLKKLEILQAEKEKTEVEEKDSNTVHSDTDSNKEDAEVIHIHEKSSSNSSYVTVKSSVSTASEGQPMNQEQLPSETANETVNTEAAAPKPTEEQPAKAPEKFKLNKTKAVQTQLNTLKKSSETTMVKLQNLKQKCQDLEELGLNGAFYPKQIDRLKNEKLAKNRRESSQNGKNYDTSSTKSESRIETSTTEHYDDSDDGDSSDVSSMVSSEQHTAMARNLPKTMPHPDVPLASASRRNSDVSSVTNGRQNRRGGRVRRKKNKEPQQVRNHGAMQKVSKKEKLVIQLLGLSHEEREVFLLLKAHKYKLIVLNEQTLQNEIKPAYISVFNQLKMEAKSEITQEISHALRDHQVQQVKKAKALYYYEGLVTRLVNGIDEQVDLKSLDQKMVLQNVSQAKTNGYLKAENVQALNEYVQKLVELKAGYVIDGEIRINAKNSAEAYVSDPNHTSDVFIKTILLRRCAFHGDTVRVFVLNKQVEVDLNETSESLDLEDPTALAAPTTANKKNIGFVIEILDQVHSRQCIGTILPAHARSPRLQPRDPKIPLVEIVFQSQEEKMKLTLDNQNTLLRVQITEWYDEKPMGKIVEVIGKVDDLAAETKAILLQNNLDVTEYAQEILDALPSATTYEIPAAEFKYRQDIRDMCVFTIDPLTAKDLDDALSCRKLENGNHEIGVHISDVSFFLKEESDLDVIVKDKATSIYLSNSVYHMLPRQLCMLCSLLPGQDKLSFSVFFEITMDGEVVSTYFTKSILNSCTQLAYEHAQDMIENPDKVFTEDDLPQIHNNYTPSQISGIVNTLHTIALKLREKRMENGALKIDQPKLSFRLNPENGRPESYCVYPIKDSNRMIEDFMLLANQSVADYIYKKFPDKSILRCHLPPNANAIIKLKQFFDKNLINFDIATSKDIQQSIADILENAENLDATKAVINVLAAKPMTRARYFCSNIAEEEAATGGELPSEFKHFALSIPIYTHFTSPIRRYADVLVHRLLAAGIGCEPVPSRSPDDLQKLANRCNVQKYNAKLAGEHSSALYFSHYIQSKGSLRMKAAVMSVYQFNLEVILTETGDVIKVYYKYLEPKVAFKVLEFDDKPNHLVLSYPQENKPPRIIRMFSEIEVEVTVNKNKLNINRIFSEC